LAVLFIFMSQKLRIGALFSKLSEGSVFEDYDMPRSLNFYNPRPDLYEIFDIWLEKATCRQVLEEMIESNR